MNKKDPNQASLVLQIGTGSGALKLCYQSPIISELLCSNMILGGGQNALESQEGGGLLS